MVKLLCLLIGAALGAGATYDYMRKQQQEECKPMTEKGKDWLRDKLKN